MKEKLEQEYKKLLEIGTKKGSLNEEDIYFKLLKYEASAQEINEIISMLEKSNIKIIKQQESDVEKEDFSDLVFKIESYLDDDYAYNKVTEECYKIALQSHNSKNSARYMEYKALADREAKVIFGGRLGEYKYYDMDAVILAALTMAEQELL